VPLEEGEIVGDRFCIERLAGSGGMGAVYRAADRSTGKPAAIKVMASLKGSLGERFLREAVVLAELSHPRIVPYVAHGVTEHGLRFLAMDWLEGENLANRLARSSLGVDESLLLVRHAAEGLAFAHERGVIHRDVKPSNLFLVGGDPSAVTVIDFGVARREGGAAILTRPGTSLGTVGYMAPEQATEATDVDARADVYGLGCVLFECLTGRAPFVGRPASILVRILREAPPPPSALCPGLTGEVDALLATLLAKRREDRLADAREVVRALDDLRARL
jgi:serine/threonine protein kinase